MVELLYWFIGASVSASLYQYALLIGVRSFKKGKDNFFSRAYILIFNKKIGSIFEYKITDEIEFQKILNHNRKELGKMHDSTDLESRLQHSLSH